jgi:hypothetical protein
LVNFGGYNNGICWYILRPFGIFVGYLVYFSVFESCIKKNLATLDEGVLQGQVKLACIYVQN